MKLITVFTPTYNRAYSLPQLFDSLCRQTSDDFLWSIIDDGSTDNTEALVSEWQKQAKFEILYEKVLNGGKMRAHNKGVAKCTTELFVCVDSDDFLTDDAVETIVSTWQNRAKSGFVGGIAAYKTMRKGDSYYIPARFPTTEDSPLIWLYEHGFKGETTLIFATEVIRKFPFPEFEGEKFIPEGSAYILMDQEYKYLLLDKSLTICEYQEDGYSLNSLKLTAKNLKGKAFLYNLYLKYKSYTMVDRIKCMVKYITFSRLGKVKNIFRDMNGYHYLYPIALVLSIGYELKVRRRFKIFK